MPVSANDLFFFKPDEWITGQDSTTEVLDTQRIQAVIAAAEVATTDLEFALALMDVIRDDLQLSGTTGGERIEDHEMRVAVRALEFTSARAGHAIKLPFRDHAGWRSYWIRQGASGPGGWQARRALLGDLFDEPYQALLVAQDRALSATLTVAISPHDRLGWPEIDTEIGELRRHFHTATTPQDYRALGNDCVHITEALSRQVYDHAEHGAPDDDGEPPSSQTKLRLDRYIEARLPGSDNKELRRYARATIELAQVVKHRPAPTRTDAGIVADALISLSNLLRRLDAER